MADAINRDGHFCFEDSENSRTFSSLLDFSRTMLPFARGAQNNTAAGQTLGETLPPAWHRVILARPLSA